MGEVLLKLLGPTMAIVLGAGMGTLLAATFIARQMRISPRQALLMIYERLLDRLRGE